MQRRRRLAVATAAACALLLPGSALAQSAGDEQYKDPFPTTGGGANTQDVAQTPTNTSGAKPLSQQPPGGSTGTSSGGGNSSSGTSSGNTATTGTQAKPQGQGLPATGSEPGMIALAGLGLLMSGLGLRWREPSA